MENELLLIFYYDFIIFAVVIKSCMWVPLFNQPIYPFFNLSNLFLVIILFWLRLSYNLTHIKQGNLSIIEPKFYYNNQSKCNEIQISKPTLFPSGPKGKSSELRSGGNSLHSISGPKGSSTFPIKNLMTCMIFTHRLDKESTHAAMTEIPFTNYKNKSETCSRSSLKIHVTS